MRSLLTVSMPQQMKRVGRIDADMSPPRSLRWKTSGMPSEVPRRGSTGSSLAIYPVLVKPVGSGPRGTMTALGRVEFYEGKVKHVMVSV